MPPNAQRLREATAIMLIAFGVISTLFNTITFLFSPNSCMDTGIGAMQCGGSDGVSIPFSYRALGATGALLNPVVILALAGAVVLVHQQPRSRGAKAMTLTCLITTAVAGLLGLIALFASFGADRMQGFLKTTNFFIGVAEFGLTCAIAWVCLSYFRQYLPARQPGSYGPPPNQWGPQQQRQPGSAPQGWGPTPHQPQQQHPGPLHQWGPPPGPQQ